MAKRKSPAVYVRRGGVLACEMGERYRAEEWVHTPVSKDGGDVVGVTALCYKEFSRITGIKLKPGEIAKVRITGEIIK